jgi:hypothetical protein
MQTRITGHVTRSEWRWVIWISLTLLLLSFSPYLLLATLRPPGDDYQFMGVLHDHYDGAASLARIQQGIDGDWLVELQYAPEPQNSALMHPLYTTLGQLARLTLPSSILIFHLIRVLAAILMFLTIYQLAASIWVKTRTRRIFFLIVSVSSGLGWLVALLGNPTNAFLADLLLPQPYPLYSATANVHYPLAIACLALLLSTLIAIFRPGEHEMPSVDNGGIVVFFTSVALAFIYPDALIPLGLAFLISVLLQWMQQRKITIREWRWGLWFFVPALPILAYDLLLLIHNPGVASWVMQRGLLPSPLELLLSLGLALLLALPGLWRAIRNFEPDGDRLMLLWLAAMIILAYLPLPEKHYFWIGLMLPIAYFATRAMEDVWLHYIRRRRRKLVYAFGLLLLGMSHILWLFSPLIPIFRDWSLGITLEPGYVAAFQVLENTIDEDEVILASPAVSLWIPAWVGGRVVYGHYAETPDAHEQLSMVREWFQLGSSQLDQCDDLLERYDIRYIIVGPHEIELGDVTCREILEPVFNAGEVTIFEYSGT